MSLWETLSKPGEWLSETQVGAGLREDLSADIEQFAEGDISLSHLLLRQVGNAGKVVGNTLGIPVGMAFSALPAEAQKAVGEAFVAAKEGAMDVPGVKEVVDYVDRNPVLKRDLEALWDAGDLLGFSMFRKPFHVIGKENMITKQPDLYHMDPRKRVKNLASVSTAGAKQIPNSLFNPNELARINQTGFGVVRRNELLDPKKLGETDAKAVQVGSLNANKAMELSTGNGTPLGSNNPIVNMETLATASVRRPNRVKRLIAHDSPEVPKGIVDSFYDDIIDTARPNNSLENALSRVTNSGGFNPHAIKVIVRNKDSVYDRLYSEVVGSATKNAPSFARFYNHGVVDTFMNTKGLKSMTKEAWEEFIQLSDHFSYFNWHDGKLTPTEALKAALKGAPKGLKEGEGLGTALYQGLQTGAEQGFKKGLKAAADVSGLPAGVTAEAAKMAARKAAEANAAFAAVGLKNTPSPKAMMEHYLKGKQKLRDFPGSKKKGEALNQNEKVSIELIDKWNASVKTPAAKVSPDGDFLDYTTGIMSTDQTLAGMRVTYKIDLKGNNVYGGALDGHNLVGTDLPGGAPVVTILPLQKLTRGAKKPKNSKATQELVDQAEKEALRVAELTGVQRGAKEALPTYVARAIAETKVKPGLKEYGQVGYNGLLTGQAAVQLPQETQEP